MLGEDMLAFTSSILRSLVVSLRLVSGTLFSFFPFSVAPRRQHSISRMQLKRMFAQRRRRRRRRSNSRKREGEREKLRDRWMDGRSRINISRSIFLMRQSGVSGLWFFFSKKWIQFSRGTKKGWPKTADWKMLLFLFAHRVIARKLIFFEEETHAVFREK